MDKVHTFRGRPITELTHEELLEAYKHVADKLWEEREWNRKAAEMESLFVQASQSLRTLRR